MKKILVYFFGGLACVGAGAGVYIASATYSRPAAPPSIFAERATTLSAINNLLPLVAGKISKSSVDATGPLGSDTLRQTQGDKGLPRDDDKIATILFAGDIMLGRSVAVQIAKNSNDYPFSKIKDTVSAADYAIANLEGPFTKINNAPENNMRFHFDPALGPAIVASGFDAFSLANNHGLDQGSKGFADGIKNLSDIKLGYFGDVSSDTGPILKFEIRGQKFAAIGLHDVYRKIDPAIVAKEIEEAKKDNAFVIIYPHWGEEYQHKQNTRQIELAHAFIDAGADLVVGSHPHVIQGIEKYKDKLIFYSLGNLVFDQYFSVDTQQGLAIRLLKSFSATAPKGVELLPYEIPKSQPLFVDGDKKEKILTELSSWSAPELKDQIVAGMIKF